MCESGNTGCMGETEEKSVTGDGPVDACDKQDDGTHGE